MCEKAPLSAPVMVHHHANEVFDIGWYHDGLCRLGWSLADSDQRHEIDKAIGKLVK
jgi:hypothetical protein